MKKKIVFINQNSGYLMIDVVNAFVPHYDEIVLLAGVIKPMERALHFTVRTQKIIEYDRSSSGKRMYTWIWASIQIFFLLLFKYRHYEVIYTTNPPLAYLASLLVRQKFSLIIYDTYPNALKNIGIKEKNLMYRLWVKFNKQLFKRAQNVFTLSNGMAEELSFYLERERIKVIQNWSGSGKFKPVIKEVNPFIRDHCLDDKFIVLYSGNIGFTHCLEAVIEVAKILEKEENICFLIIGEGGRKASLIQLAKKYSLRNCIFMTWQTSDILPYSLAAADLGVITINDESAGISVPSKTYNLLAVGAPLLCITPEKSELSSLVRKYENGMCFENGNLNQIASFILEVSKNKIMQTEFSKRSLEASKDYSYSNAMEYL